MGSSLGPTLANAFLILFEKNWLQHCPSLSLITINCMLMISLFYLPHQNNKKPSVIFEMVDMLTCHLQLNLKSKTECSF